MKSKTLITIFVLACAVSAMAQESRFSFFDEPQKKAKLDYHLTTSWRLIAGYVQDWQNSPDLLYPDMYLHGGKIGVSVDFNLPYNISLQTGLQYALSYGQLSQHWASASAEFAQTEIVDHHVVKHTLNIPIHLYYRQQLYKDLAMVFYGGPQLQAGLYQKDNIKMNLSAPTQKMLEDMGVPTTSYNRNEKELLPFNLQISVGGGLEWANYRLQAGYDFGLINMVRQYPLNHVLQYSYMREWSWNVCFVYKL